MPMIASPDGLKNGMQRGAHLPEITRVDDDLDVPVLLRDQFELFDRAVGGVVVDKDMFVGILAEACHYGAHLRIYLVNVVLFVVAGRDNADGLQNWLCVGVSRYCLRSAVVRNRVRDRLPGIDSVAAQIHIVLWIDAADEVRYFPDVRLLVA